MFPTKVAKLVPLFAAGCLVLACGEGFDEPSDAPDEDPGMSTQALKFCKICGVGGSVKRKCYWDQRKVDGVATNQNTDEWQTCYNAQQKAKRKACCNRTGTFLKPKKPSNPAGACDICGNKKPTTDLKKTVRLSRFGEMNCIGLINAAKRGIFRTSCSSVTNEARSVCCN